MSSETIIFSLFIVAIIGYLCVLFFYKKTKHNKAVGVFLGALMAVVCFISLYHFGTNIGLFQAPPTSISMFFELTSKFFIVVFPITVFIVSIGNKKIVGNSGHG